MNRIAQLPGFWRILVGNGKWGRCPEDTVNVSKDRRAFSEAQIQPVTEVKVSTSRLFNVLICVALVMLVAFTAREALATADVLSQGNVAKGAKTLECAMLPSQLSIQSGYVKERGVWVSFTGQGPTGVDGGLMNLLAAYPSCSR
jgi:hypothetical protein